MRSRGEYHHRGLASVSGEVGTDKVEVDVAPVECGGKSASGGRDTALAWRGAPLVARDMLIAFLRRLAAVHERTKARPVCERSGSAGSQSGVAAPRRGALPPHSISLRVHCKE